MGEGAGTSGMVVSHGDGSMDCSVGRVSVVSLLSLDLFKTRWALLWGAYGAFF